MHNLAIALSRKGYIVTGSDDEIFEPSATRLKNQEIYPQSIGWDDCKITKDLDAVILGMHARVDNPELLKAKELNLPIYSYPEYLYEQSKSKIRIVIGGSHGKTTITSMLLHAVKEMKIDADYMVGAQLEGYDCMVKLSNTAPFMIIEGDEYLSSPIDRRPKFHLYKPNIALISGIAWDHINVFPTFDNYIDQFKIFCECIEKNGKLIYNKLDQEVKKIGENYSNSLKTIPYEIPDYKVTNSGTVINFNKNAYSLKIFGSHNLQNMIGAMYLANEMGISNHEFLTAMSTFTGAGKRLQKVVESEDFVMFKDFAHSPSKLLATTKAVKEQYQEKEVIACMELHTFSSLKKEFLLHYENTMSQADEAIVYFSPDVVLHKKLEPISIEQVKNAFGGNVNVFNKTEDVLQFLRNKEWKNKVLLMMSSGTFDGINYEELGVEITQNIK